MRTVKDLPITDRFMAHVMHRRLVQRTGQSPLTLMTGGAGWQVGLWLPIAQGLVDSRHFNLETAVDRFHPRARPHEH